MTDISISDIERISYDEIDRKLEQLSFYINRVQHRLNAIKNVTTPLNQPAIQQFNEKVRKKARPNEQIRVRK
ncbi:MAG: hypothetical protein VW397_01590 [Candidatus Margulisiibacteriota bacterium]